MQSSFDTRTLSEHTRYLRAYALRRLNDRDLADDLVQDTLLAALSTEQSFQGRSSVRTWLTGILKHKIVDAYRDRSRGHLSLDELSAAHEVDAGSGIAADTGHFEFDGDPQKQLEHKRFWESFKRELGRMPARTAAAFVLSEFTDTGTEALCERFGISAGALWVMRCRARNALRSALLPAMGA
jgi:RNA polymerase sigma-70 factor (ECF subfamily)